MDIRSARKAAGLTQEQLAALIGVNRATLSKYESGQIIPSILQFRKIAQELNVPFYSLCPFPANQDNEIESLLAELEAQKDDPKDIDLLAAYRKLNKEGQKIAIERVEELTQIPKYQRTEPPEAPEEEKEGYSSIKEKKPPEGL